MAGGDKTKVDDYISAEKYIQHNKEVADGLGAARGFLLQDNNPLVYRKIVLLVGQGNFVASLCEAAWQGKPMAQVDIFRLESGKIVEHWDNVEPVPEGPQPNSGKF